MSVQSLQAWVPSDTFATRLVLVRRELGITVKEAASRCGLHYATWSTWENGRTPANAGEVVAAIANGLHVDRDWLMWGGPLGHGPNGPESNATSPLRLDYALFSRRRVARRSLCVIQGESLAAAA
jgi:transcriptional regulator with XRE-family HTH domain